MLKNLGNGMMKVQVGNAFHEVPCKDVRASLKWHHGKGNSDEAWETTELPGQTAHQLYITTFMSICKPLLLYVHECAASACPFCLMLPDVLVQIQISFKLVMLLGGPEDTVHLQA